MPELPEAETIVRDLQKKIVGRTVVGTKVFKSDILGNTTPAKLARVMTNGRTLGRRVKRPSCVARPFSMP